MTAEEIQSFAARLAGTLPGDDVERVDQLKALTVLRNAVEGRQVRIGVAIEDSRRAAAPGDHTIQITTPTGHTYRSRAPALTPPQPVVEVRAQRASKPRHPGAVRVDIIEGPRPVLLDLTS